MRNLISAVIVLAGGCYMQPQPVVQPSNVENKVVVEQKDSEHTCQPPVIIQRPCPPIIVQPPHHHPRPHNPHHRPNGDSIRIEIEKNQGQGDRMEIELQKKLD